MYWVYGAGELERGMVGCGCGCGCCWVTAAATAAGFGGILGEDTLGYAGVCVGGGGVLTCDGTIDVADGVADDLGEVDKRSISCLSFSRSRSS